MGVCVDKKIARGYPAAARISESVLYYAAVSGESIERICMTAGFTSMTYYARIRDPRGWRVSELLGLAHLFGISFEQLVAGVSRASLREVSVPGRS